MRLLIIGANGQLGSDLVRAASERGLDAVAATRSDAEVTDPEAVAAFIDSAGAQAVINTAAWTDLPGCESDPGRAFAVNSVGALNVARAAESAGVSLVHISTDYVFDGAATTPYLEPGARRALNVYGASKLAGEDLVLSAAPGAAIVRVAGLFGIAGASGKGGNFVETMLRLQREGRPLRVVADQVTSPTNTADLAGPLLDLALANPEGIYHLAPADCCSWFQFASAIFEEANVEADLQPTTAREYGGPVVRPAFSALGSTRLAPLPGWREGLQRYLRARERSA